MKQDLGIEHRQVCRMLRDNARQLGRLNCKLMEIKRLLKLNGYGNYH